MTTTHDGERFEPLSDEELAEIHSQDPEFDIWVQTHLEADKVFQMEDEDFCAEDFAEVA